MTVIEKENLGGVCLNVGCIPSKALISAAEAYQNVSRYQEMGIEIDADHVKLNYAKVQKWKRSVIDRLTGGVSSLLKGHQIEVIQGEAASSARTKLSLPMQTAPTITIFSIVFLQRAPGRWSCPICRSVKEFFHQQLH